MKLTLTRTAALLIMLKIGSQIPISRARSGVGRRVATTYLYASTRISKILFTKAKSGASGNADTKRVTKPNCITKTRFIFRDVSRKGASFFHHEYFNRKRLFPHKL